MPDTINPKMPIRRWSRPYAITLSDVVADKNLQRNGVPYRYIQNIGVAGVVMIAWEPAAVEESIYLGVGQDFEGGLWLHAKTTGTTAGVVLRGFVGMEGR